MKRLSILVAIAVISTSLYSCAKQDTNTADQTEGNITTQEPEQTEAPKTNYVIGKPQATDFDKEIIQVEFEDIEFSIPSTWEKLGENMFYPGGQSDASKASFMFLMGEASSALSSDELKAAYPVFFKNLGDRYFGDKYTLEKSGFETVDNISRAYADIDHAVHNDLDLYVRSYLVAADTRPVCITFCQSPKSDIDYFSDFEKVVNSIKKRTNDIETIAEQTDEPVAEETAPSEEQKDESDYQSTEETVVATKPKAAEFDLSWRYPTKRDVTYWLLDTDEMKLVTFTKKSKSYTENDCIGNLEEGLHTIRFDTGEPNDSYFILKKIGNSTYVVSCDAEGNYDEYDIYSYSRDISTPVSYLRKNTTYYMDHSE